MGHLVNSLSMRLGWTNNWKDNIYLDISHRCDYIHHFIRIRAMLIYLPFCKKPWDEIIIIFSHFSFYKKRRTIHSIISAYFGKVTLFGRGYRERADYWYKKVTMLKKYGSRITIANWLMTLSLRLFIPPILLHKFEPDSNIYNPRKLKKKYKTFYKRLMFKKWADIKFNTIYKYNKRVSDKVFREKEAVKMNVKVNIPKPSFTVPIFPQKFNDLYNKGLLNFRTRDVRKLLRLKLMHRTRSKKRLYFMKFLDKLCRRGWVGGMNTPRPRISRFRRILYQTLSPSAFPKYTSFKNFYEDLFFSNIYSKMMRWVCEYMEYIIGNICILTDSVSVSVERVIMILLHQLSWQGICYVN